MNICVFGSSSDLINKEYLDFAEKLASELVKRGHGIVFEQANTELWEQPHEVPRQKTERLSA